MEKVLKGIVPLLNTRAIALVRTGCQVAENREDRIPSRAFIIGSCVFLNIYLKKGNVCNAWDEGEEKRS
uniref:Uncharacterized protein n=1 Tax=Thermosporothrix sp. COM3 TaxID=2490863 RepID=A0A455SJ98_9CHLR|nr:hypothetical protein KTC_25570 [Thermosporothrix sp. COM3]